MKKLLLVVCLGLCACDEPTEQQVVQTAKTETAQVIKDIENNHVPTLEERKLAHERRMLDICYNRFIEENINYPTIYKNNICICFAEKTTEFVASSEKEMNKYNQSKLYQLKVQERFFDECAEKNKKYKFF